MRGTEKHDAVRGDIEGTIILMLGGFQVVRVQQSALNQDSSQTVAYPNDGVLGRLLILAIVGESSD